jgi:hypothetical protein
MASSLEEFLRMNTSWGLPSPAFRAGFPKPAFTDPAPVAPMAPPMPMMPLYGAPPAPVEEEVDPALAPMGPMPPQAPQAPQSGYAPAPFTLPGNQFDRPKNADVFGQYTQTLGLRNPAEQQLNPAQALMQPPQQAPQPPRYLQAQPQQQGPPAQQPGAGPGQGMQQGMAGARRQPQQWKESPALARRYPGATRMRDLVDRAREKRGYV